jgi:hypothetical protein
MGEFNRGLNINTTAMPSIGESHQAGVRDIPTTVQQKQITVAEG